MRNPFSARVDSSKDRLCRDGMVIRFKPDSTVKIGMGEAIVHGRAPSSTRSTIADQRTCHANVMSHHYRPRKRMPMVRAGLQALQMNDNSLTTA